MNPLLDINNMMFGRIEPRATQKKTIMTKFEFNEEFALVFARRNFRAPTQMELGKAYAAMRLLGVTITTIPKKWYIKGFKQKS